MSQEFDNDRRRFLGAVVKTVAAAKLGLVGSAFAETTWPKTASSVTSIWMRSGPALGRSPCCKMAS